MRISFIIICIVLSVVGYTFFSCDIFHEEEPAPFTMQVFPDSMEAITGQRCVFLVKIEDEGGGRGEGEDVTITGNANNSEVNVTPTKCSPGKVAEATVIPDTNNIGTPISLEINGQRNGMLRSINTSINIVQGEDYLKDSAEQIRNRFIPWLAENYPEFGLSNETDWTGTIVTPNILIVANYLFFSDRWEMDLTYHVMIPPHDWARIYLRQRFEEMQPSYAFEISSLEAQDTPKPITPPETVLR